MWFSGHWGFQWYAERAGARPLVRGGDDTPRRGDFVFVDEQAFNQELIDDYPRKRRVAVFADSSPGGRIMNREAHAGFYSNEWGEYPWVWSTNTEVDRITLWRIPK